MAHTTSGAEVEALAGRLYAEHRGRLLAIARQNTDRPEDAEEALNEAFAVFLAKFDPREFPEPVAWLTTTLKRIAGGPPGGRGASGASSIEKSNGGWPAAATRTSARRAASAPRRCARRWRS